MSTATIPRTSSTSSVKTLDDLVKRLGRVPLNRIRFDPMPGTATIDDVVRLEAKEGILCELIEGTLVEKAVAFEESSLAALLLELLGPFVRRGNLGMLTGEAGMMEILANLVRIPDVAFVSWDRLPGRRRPKKPVPRIVPNLCVEILSKSNTRGEMKRKREEYFEAGVELVWEIDPIKRTVRIFTSPNESEILEETDTLDGGTVLPGFELSLKEFFAELDRHG